MTFGARVTAYTQDGLLPKLADNVLRSNPFIYRTLGNAKPGRGTKIVKPIKYQVSGTAASFSGLDTFTASLTDTKVNAEFDMRGYRIPLAVGGMEVVANAVSETQITDLVRAEIEEKQAEFIDGLGTIAYGLGTGNNSKDPIGLGAIVDDGTDVSTLGGLARSTYTIMNATRTASGGTLTLAKLAALHSAISDGTINSDPTIMYSNPTVWDLYENLLTPTVRENYSLTGYYDIKLTGGVVRPSEGLKGMGGFTALTYRGIPFVKDRKATAQNIFMINEYWLQWYGWDASLFGNGYKSIAPATSQLDSAVYNEMPSKYLGMAWSGWQVPTANGVFGAVASLIILGNLTSWGPSRHGRLTGITSS
jgi:hypothetical protein